VTGRRSGRAGIALTSRGALSSLDGVAMVTKKKRLLDRFTPLVIKWRNELWLRDWHYDISQVDDLDLTSKEADRSEGSRKAAAQVRPSYRYRQAHFKVGENALRNCKAEELDTIACHETCHVVLAPITSFVQDIMEQLPEQAQDLAYARWAEVHEDVTSHLTRAFTWREERRLRRLAKKPFRRGPNPHVVNTATETTVTQ